MGSVASFMMAPAGSLIPGGKSFVKDTFNSFKGENSNNSPIPLPQPPNPDAAAVKASNIASQRRASATQSIFTSPLGVGGTADITKKILLGQ